MKINQSSPDEIVVSDFPVFAGGFCALSFLGLMWMCIQTSMIHPVNTHKLIGPVLGAVLSAAGAAAFLKRSVIHIDRRLGRVIWSRWGIFGTEKGHISFADIKDAVVEVLLDTRRNRNTYRVALLTTAGHWPLTDYYYGSRDSSEKVKDALRKFFGFSAQPSTLSLEERLRSLVASGHSLEAIKLVRMERGLSLADAEKVVQAFSSASNKFPQWPG
jgi:hypothetical protein